MGDTKVSNLIVGYTSDQKRFVAGSNEVTNSLRKQKDAAKNASKHYIDLKQELKQNTTAAKKTASAFAKLGAAIKRIVFYRMIRNAIKQATQAIKEGINNLYQYSAALNSLDAGRAKNTMDGFATTALYVKNSLGAALMPALQMLLPIVNAISDAFVTATNAVNQFLTALKGESIFTKAKKYAVEYADALGGASGAAKELKKQLFGFDELNVFSEPSNGGGGGASGLDYSQMFEESQISSFFEKIRQTVQNNLGQDFIGRFKINWKSVLSDWSGLTGEDVAKKILTGFYGLMGGVSGFAIGGPVGAVVGTLLGTTLGIGFTTVTFNDDGKVSESEVGNMIKQVAVALTGGVIGFTVGGVKGAMLGVSVAASLSALIQTFAVDPDTTMTEVAFVGLIIAAVKQAIKAKSLYFSTTAVAGAEASLGIIALAGLTLNIAQILMGKGYDTTQEKMAQIIANVANAIIGGVAGALFFTALPGVTGILLGITIACGLNFLINKVFMDYTPQSKRELEMGVNSFTSIDQANANAYMHFGTPDYGSGAIGRAKGRANGGFVEAGTYFYAGEQGPELVGVVGGRTNVTNQDQFTAGMEGIMDNTNTVIMQAAQALISAIQNKDMTAVVNVGDRQIVNAYDRGKRLAGAGLVE